MSGSTLSQPTKLVLNSKFRQSNEEIGDITYHLVTPIQGASRARLSEYTTIYLANLIRAEQASLQYRLYNAVGTLLYSYNIDLSSLTSNYYDSVADVVTDIQALIDGLFVGTGQYDPSIKPTLSYDTKTRTVSFIDAPSPNTHYIQFDATTSQFWYKLGFPDGSYTATPSTPAVAPSYPSVIPINEVYIEIDGMLSENTLLRTDSPLYHNNTRIAGIVPFSNVRLGDLFAHQFATIPEYELMPNNSLQNIRVRLLDSTGQAITSFKADYRLMIDLIY